MSDQDVFDLLDLESGVADLLIAFWTSPVCKEHLSMNNVMRRNPESGDDIERCSAFLEVAPVIDLQSGSVFRPKQHDR